MAPPTGTHGRPGEFCGQALVQRAPRAAELPGARASGGGDGAAAAGAATAAEPPSAGAPLFVHRTFAKYNDENLLLDASWRWTTTALAESGGGSGLVQRGWCMVADDRAVDVSLAGALLAPRVGVEPTDEWILALAREAIAARLEMVGLL